MFWYYQEGNPRANKSPDVMVIKGVGNHERRSFKSWEEGATPCVIFEITSESSMVEDMVTKSALYARLGVREYFIFDPMREYVSSRMLGFRLEAGEYAPVMPDGDGRIFSEELGVFLIPEGGGLLRALDPQTGQKLPSLQEAMAFAQQEAQRAQQETQRAEQEAQRAEKLTAQLRALGIEPEA